MLTISRSREKARQTRAVFSPAGTELLVSRLRNDLADCVSVFHQLLHLSAHRDPVTRIYRYGAGREQVSPEFAAELRHCHTIAFEKWLCLSLREQYTELLLYLATLTAADRSLFLRLIGSKYGSASLVPDRATAEQRDLFSSDLRALAAAIVRP
jgi:hypothetical protein